MLFTSIYYVSFTIKTAIESGELAEASWRQHGNSWSTGLLLKVSRGKYDSKYFGLVLVQEINSVFVGYEGNNREIRYDWRSIHTYLIY